MSKPSDKLQQARSGDGEILAYNVTGNPSALLRFALTHSLALDHDFWAPVVAQLSAALGQEAAILTWDCRGHGQSSKPRQAYTVEQFAGDLADLLDHLKWPDAILAGASMGGCISLAFAGLYPQRTKGLGLFDTTAWYGADAPKQWAERADKALSDGLTALVGFQKIRWFGDDFRDNHADVVDQCLDVFLRNDLEAYAASCRMLGAADLRAHLPKIRVPTRVLVGAEDLATPVAMAQVLHQGIAGSTLTIVPDARHLSPLEVPDVIVGELRALADANLVQG